MLVAKVEDIVLPSTSRYVWLGADVQLMVGWQERRKIGGRKKRNGGREGQLLFRELFFF